MSISYDYYRVFYYVAAYRSISRAANVLSASQPGISRTISTLEAQLGVKLFNRSSAGVTLTESGNNVFAHVEPAFRHLNAIEEEIRSAKDLKKGILKIGISSGLTRGVIEEVLAPTLDEFHFRYPDIKLDVFHNPTPVLISDVRNDLIDIAFITIDARNNAEKTNRKQQILYSYSDIAVAGTEYRELSGRPVSISELREYQIIGLGENTDTFQYYKDIFADYGLEYSPSIVTISTGQTLIYAMQNFGIGFIHPKDAGQYIEEGRLVQIKLKERLPKRKVTMIKNSKEKQSAKVLEQMLTDYLNG